MDEEHVFIGVYAPNKIEVNILVQFFSFSVDVMIGKFFFSVSASIHVCCCSIFFLNLFCFRQITKQRNVKVTCNKLFLDSSKQDEN